MCRMTLKESRFKDPQLAKASRFKAYAEASVPGPRPGSGTVRASCWQLRMGLLVAVKELNVSYHNMEIYSK